MSLGRWWGEKSVVLEREKQAGSGDYTKYAVCFPIGCPSICKSADCLSAHLSIFIQVGKHDRFENVDMWTCRQIWLFSACGRPGTTFYAGPPHGNLNPLSSPSMILSWLPHQDPARKKRWKMRRQTEKRDDRWTDRHAKLGQKKSKNGKSVNGKSAVQETEKLTDE
jgi:hypothetical protein